MSRNPSPVTSASATPTADPPVSSCSGIPNVPPFNPGRIEIPAPSQATSTSTCMSGLMRPYASCRGATQSPGSAIAWPTVTPASHVNVSAAAGAPGRPATMSLSPSPSRSGAITEIAAPTLNSSAIKNAPWTTYNFDVIRSRLATTRSSRSSAS